MAAVAVLTAALMSGLLAACTADADRPATEAEAARCHGVRFDEVRGRAPRAGAPELASYPADGSVCAAYWLPHVDRWFVPQALEVDGATAYVGGYRWARAYGDRPCQVAVLDLRTGKVRAFVERFAAPVYRPTPTFCRHGGGLEATAEGLWVVEAERLWLLDPERLGARGDLVLRVWRLDRSVKGSTLAIGDGRLAIGSFRARGPARVVRFRVADVLADGVDDLRLRGDATDARAVGRRRALPRLQGLTWARGGLWSSVSRTACGELVAPDGRRHAFVPGGEDVELVGRDIWTVSESGTRPYLDPREPVVPAVLRLDRAAVMSRSSRCAS
ncbi:hypothetical protein EKO23_00630 [Nocardioides guangzhouensis]|uniref:Glutaminyl-peptide cyclotransferase n=1 Tax=Nocardioides guangzhouensis TaxID=2497878 RepID=A0A4Q4ZN47_9ACTN|nr:hypothetical protein [Nocardioides guangzhouensis]RYP88976.1 hypothetical protein EKO23_00630 [Nocardioides guangzhouensis]